MANSCVSDEICMKSCGGMGGTAVWVELDHIPLTQRQKLLHASTGNQNSGNPNSGIVDDEHPKTFMPPVDVVVKCEYGYCKLQDVSCLPSGCSTRNVMGQEQDPKSQHLKEVSSEANYNIIPLEFVVNQHLGIGTQYGAVDCVSGNWHETQACLCSSLQKEKCLALQTDAGGSEIANVNISSSPRSPTLCDVPASIKIENSEILLCSTENVRKASLHSDLSSLKIKKEIPDDNVDDLDHIVLKERQRMLLTRKMLGFSNPAHEGGSGGSLDHTAVRVKEEIHSVDGKIIAASNQHNYVPEGNTSLFESPSGTAAESSLSTNFASLKSAKSISVNLQECDHVYKSGGMVLQSNLYEEQGGKPVKNDDQNTSTFPTSVKVKDEPWEVSEFHNVKADELGNFSFNFKNVKSEREVQNECRDDLVEDMCLRDRLKFLMSGEGLNLNTSTSYPSLKKIRHSGSERNSNFSGSPEPLSIKRPRKRKTTATDSVETALEEDAPGLLQVLIDKGVLVDEIKLYGEMESDEALDESFCEDSFAELEAVISKLFSQRHSFIKFPSIHGRKASRASYCLACLLSLVEQTRYLQFRKSPVEWGWCRDLQSFIFVFERHNRIVLERPEYGFATYFFELVESLPIAWQIKRLVTAMKLTSCSRISLIENKALTVGEDLTEGEAHVLMEYGWTPNTGLGTMLNYCDRVVHDRKNDNDSSEWRSKIGKLLMDGYNGGTIVAPNIPERALKYQCAQSSNRSCSLNI